MEDKAISSINIYGTKESLMLSQLRIKEEESHCVRKETVSHALDSSCVTPEAREELECTKWDPFDYLPDHLIVEVLVRVPVSNWVSAACVRKRWAATFRCETLWQTALMKRWPNAEGIQRWPGPIRRGSHKTCKLLPCTISILRMTLKISSWFQTF